MLQIKNYFWLKVIGLVLLMIIMQQSEVLSQCAMCRATVENNVSQQAGLGKGLNSGILYLMTIPYLLIGALAYLWYRSSLKETQQKNRIIEILKRRLT